MAWLCKGGRCGVGVVRGEREEWGGGGEGWGGRGGVGEVRGECGSGGGGVGAGP